MVNNYPGPGLGGGEVQLLPVIAALIAQGARVTLLAPAGSGFAERAAAMGARVVETPMSMRGPRSAIVAIRAAAALDVPAEGRRPVLVGTGYFTNILVRLARGGAAARAAVINVVAVVPGASRHDGSGPLALAARRAVDAMTRFRVDRHVAVSEAVRDGLVADGADPARVSVVLNGVDLARLDAAAASRDGLSALGEVPVVACIARLEPVKGVEHLVRAAALVEGAVFAVAGTGSLESRLREIAASQRGGSRVEFLGDVPSAAALMMRADVVVVPSLSEAFGLVAAEAMALGRPLVATRVGGLPEVIDDGETGLLVDAGDPSVLADAIRRCLEDRELAARLGAAGRTRARTRFAADRMSAEYVNLIDEVAYG
jgi:glycosyltransferase involved in cell wall biosynthesis